MIKSKKNISLAESLISFTSILCKIFERIVYFRLKYIKWTNHLIHDKQCGFRHNLSTLHQLCSIHTMTINKPTSCISNMIYRKLLTEFLFEKIYRSNLGGNIILFINNFLTNRKFTAQVGRTLSSIRILIDSAIQGWIFFLILL